MKLNHEISSKFFWEVVQYVKIVQVPQETVTSESRGFMMIEPTYK